jgi:hypothetical protein
MRVLCAGILPAFFFSLPIHDKCHRRDAGATDVKESKLMLVRKMVLQRLKCSPI